jgi:hypothetical protein
MRQASRIVQRLRLRGSSEAEVRRVVRALEDGFRTATLPDAGARIVIVRRLTLGRLQSGASSQSVSLLLESRLSHAGWTLVHGAAETADRCPSAVWFRDSLEAHEVAALRVAAGLSVDTWFWPLAVAALSDVSAPADRLRAIAFSLAAREEAPAALPTWTASLVRAGHHEQLIAALRPGDGTTLLRAAGVGGPPAPTGSASVTRIDSADASLATAWTAGSGPAAGARGRFDPSDDRLQFIERMLSHANSRSSIVWRSSAVANRTEPTSDDVGLDLRPQAVSRADSALGNRSSTTAQPVTCTTGRSDADGGAPIEDQAAFDAPPRTPLAPDVRCEPVSRVDPSQIDTGDSGQPGAWGGDAPVLVARQPRSAWDAGSAPTAAGGLLFLVPVLERLGFDQWYEHLGARELPPLPVLAGQIFHVLLSRLRVSDEDSAWRLAASPEEPRSAVAPSAYELVASACGRNSTHELIRGAVPDLWLTACRRLLRRHARIGLASLVLRSARFTLTATHVDVFMALSAADVRVRRAGLDIDPGWVPWLGKVVTFHYEDRPWN